MANIDNLDQMIRLQSALDAIVKVGNRRNIKRNDMEALIQALRHIGNQSELQYLKNEINRIATDHTLTWEQKYDAIFSKKISTRFFEIANGFSYYDPDSSYEDDVRAFHDAVNDWVK